MPKQIGGKTVQITVRVGGDVPERASLLAHKMAPDGMRLARADVLRAALMRGLAAMEGDVSVPGVAEPSLDPSVTAG